MMRLKREDIATHDLTTAFHTVHKVGRIDSDFGLDNSPELIENSFGLYSTAGLKPKISPIKSEFFRVGFGKSGTVQLDCGLETYLFQPGDMIFTFPGQVFSLRDKSADFSAYYMLFSEGFVSDAISLKDSREQYPFFNYAGSQHIRLDDSEADEIESFIQKINREIRQRKSDIRRAIQIYLQLILVEAKRSYFRQYPVSRPGLLQFFAGKNFQTRYRRRIAIACDF